MLEKVRPNTHRENGPDLQPEAGLSEGRLALVYRYMVDAEEAEQSEEEASTTAAQEQARCDAAARTQRRLERERRRAKRLSATAGTTKLEADAAAADGSVRAPAISLTDVAGEAEEAPRSNGLPEPGGETRSRKALVKADQRAAKQAARQIAALEKKEARERKALAKAAARRKTA